MKQFRPRLSENEYAILQKLKQKGNRVLVIGDLHLPFELDGYFEFVKSQYHLNNCNKVVFIGDVIDNHFSSYHETFADGLGGGSELKFAKQKLKKWYKQFPDATVIIGNHDRIIMRKAQTSAIPKEWIRDYKDVLGVPNWVWSECHEIDGVMYEHGEGGQAQIKAKNNLQSTVCGHYHSESYVKWFVGNRSKLFAMQVGCGIDKNSYAMAYGRNFKKPVIGCGIVIDGLLAYNILMDL